MNIQLRIAGIVKESIVDGPGLRYVIFTQGCIHKCVGCHNPHTHDIHGGYKISTHEMLQEINDIKLIRGITFSGGEPFMQSEACAKLAKLVKQCRPELDIVAYTGYYYNVLLAMAKKDQKIDRFLKLIDILIDGPYDATKKDFNLPFRGSSNQNIITLSSIS